VVVVAVFGVFKCHGVQRGKMMMMMMVGGFTAKNNVRHGPLKHLNET
jgi:hypothetical protein